MPPLPPLRRSCQKQLDCSAILVNRRHPQSSQARKIGDEHQDFLLVWVPVLNAPGQDRIFTVIVQGGSQKKRNREESGRKTGERTIR